MSAPLILGTNSIKDTGYNVDNSVRLDGTDDHFSRTLTQAGTSNKAFTFSCWIKRSKRNADVPRLMHMGGSSASPTHYFRINFRDDQSGALQQYHEAGGSGFQLTTNRVFRDESAWYHIVVAVNSAATNEIDRQKIYVNGVQETSMSSSTAMSLNADLGFNDSGDVIYLFRKQQDSDHFPGYACEVAFIDGQQLAPTAFGEFDSDSPTIWKPIDFKDDVTFGTNGFYLEFKDSSNLGDDTSGNGNDLNYNFGAVNQSTDTCTNNFATINSLDGSSAGTVSEGNLILTSSGNPKSTMGFTQGKWYFECKLTTQSGSQIIGVASENMTSGTTLGSDANGWGYVIEDNALFGANGKSYHNNSLSSVLQTFANNDILGVAVDMDNQALYFSVNGTFVSSGDPTSGASKTGAVFTNLPTSGFVFPCFRSTSSGVVNANFGSPPFTISSGNADGEGFGNFEYAVPSGYFALCTKNLAEYG